MRIGDLQRQLTKVITVNELNLEGKALMVDLGHVDWQLMLISVGA